MLGLQSIDSWKFVLIMSQMLRFSDCISQQVQQLHITGSKVNCKFYIFRGLEFFSGYWFSIILISSLQLEAVVATVVNQAENIFTQSKVTSDPLKKGVDVAFEFLIDEFDLETPKIPGHFVGSRILRSDRHWCGNSKSGIVLGVSRSSSHESPRWFRRIRCRY